MASGEKGGGRVATTLCTIPKNFLKERITGQENVNLEPLEGCAGKVGLLAAGDLDLGQFLIV